MTSGLLVYLSLGLCAAGRSPVVCWSVSHLVCVQQSGHQWSAGLSLTWSVCSRAVTSGLP